MKTAQGWINSRPVGARRHAEADTARGSRITAAMAATGKLYNCQLAYDLGVTESSLSRWRSGAPMSVSMAMGLAKQLGVSIDWLVTGREGPDEEIETGDDLAEVTNLFSVLAPADRQLVVELNRAFVRHQVAPDPGT